MLGYYGITDGPDPQVYGDQRNLIAFRGAAFSSPRATLRLTSKAAGPFLALGSDPGEVVETFE
jgi:hypothetical protein